MSSLSCSGYTPTPSTRSPTMNRYLTLRAISLCCGVPCSHLSHLMNLRNSSSRNSFDPTCTHDIPTKYASSGAFLSSFVMGTSGNSIVLANIVVSFSDPTTPITSSRTDSFAVWCASVLFLCASTFIVPVGSSSVSMMLPFFVSCLSLISPIIAQSSLFCDWITRFIDAAELSSFLFWSILLMSWYLELK